MLLLYTTSKTPIIYYLPTTFSLTVHSLSNLLEGLEKKEENKINLIS